MADTADTIFALATAPGKAGSLLFGYPVPMRRKRPGACGTLPNPRVATLRILRDQEGHRLDQALVLYFPETIALPAKRLSNFIFMAL